AAAAGAAVGAFLRLIVSWLRPQPPAPGAPDPPSAPELAQSPIEALPGLENSPEQVAVLVDALPDDIHRERRRVEPALHLLPAKGRRHGRPRSRPHRVDGGDRLALTVLIGVDE